jgi:hypothetical protein
MPQRRPELRNGGTVIAARNRVIDSSSIVQHLLHLDLGLDPVIGGIKLPAEPICRPVQIIKCAVQPVFFALAVFFWDSVGAPRRSRRG